MGLDDLAALPANDLKVVQQTTVEQMVDKILGQRLAFNKATKLTWSKETRRATPGDKRLGQDGLDRRLEYTVLGRSNYFIQNGKIYNGAGRRIRLEEIPNELPFLWRNWVTEAYENHKRQALSADDSLCPICLNRDGETFVANSHADYTDHVLDKHPDIVLERMGKLNPVAVSVPSAWTTGLPDVATTTNITYQTVPTPPADPVVSTSAPVPAKGNFVCGTCQRTLSTEHGLKIHIGRAHK